MARKRSLASVVALLALVGAGVSWAGSLPFLRSVTVAGQRVIVRVEVSDLRPVEFVAAASSAEGPGGALLPTNVRLREAIRLPPSVSGIARWETGNRLVPGTYYVQVMAIETGGVTDCPPRERGCTEHWSNVRRVVVRWCVRAAA